ncbi:MAG: DNA-binding protein WhiA [Bacillota bacterium]|jgi:DNA-binding protein WhiA
MSFSSETKKQISQRISGSPCCQMAEFLALTKSDGTIGVSGGDGPYLKISSENPAVAGTIYKLTKELFREPGRLLVCKNTRLKKNNRYEIRVPYLDDTRGVLVELGIMTPDGRWDDLSRSGFPDEALKKDCCKRSYLRGAFLGSGSVNNPESGYHLEIVSGRLEHAEGLRRLLAHFEINAKICRRKNQYVLYLKNAEQISEFLLNIGAHHALLTFESERVRKGLYNDLNRTQNFDLANIDKSVAAAQKQLRAIARVEETIGLDSLTPALREAAELRKANPYLSLEELAAKADPPVGKSGMNHRMKKLRRLAEEG